MKRSIGVTVVAVLSLIGSILALLMGILLVLLYFFVTRQQRFEEAAKSTRAT